MVPGPVLVHTFPRGVVASHLDDGQTRGVGAKGARSRRPARSAPAMWARTAHCSRLTPCFIDPRPSRGKGVSVKGWVAPLPLLVADLDRGVERNELGDMLR